MTILPKNLFKAEITCKTQGFITSYKIDPQKLIFQPNKYPKNDTSHTPIYICEPTGLQNE